MTPQRFPIGMTTLNVFIILKALNFTYAMIHKHLNHTVFLKSLFASGEHWQKIVLCTGTFSLDISLLLNMYCLSRLPTFFFMFICFSFGLLGRRWGHCVFLPFQKLLIDLVIMEPKIKHYFYIREVALRLPMYQKLQIALCI